MSSEPRIAQGKGALALIAAVNKNHNIDLNPGKEIPFTWVTYGTCNGPDRNCGEINIQIKRPAEKKKKKKKPAAEKAP